MQSGGKVGERVVQKVVMVEWFRLLTKSPDWGSGGPAQALASSPFCHVAVDDIESIIHQLSGCICKVTPTYMTHLDLDRTSTSLSLRSR